jgi:ABC-type nickel/cobalt efflux system permease component RcnA
LPSRYQVAVALAVSIVTGLLAGLALPLGLFGNWTWVVSAMLIAVLAAVVCWRVCPAEHWLQLRATLLMAALPIACLFLVFYMMQGIH